MVRNTSASFDRQTSVEVSLPVGRKLTATVESVNLDKQRLKLNTKNATVDRTAMDAIKVGDAVSGTVVRHLRREHRRTKAQYVHEVVVRLDSSVLARIETKALGARTIDVEKRLPTGTTVHATVSGREQNYLKLNFGPMLEEAYREIDAKRADGAVVETHVTHAPDDQGYCFVQLHPLVDGLVPQVKRASRKVGEPMRVKVQAARPHHSLKDCKQYFCVNAD
jgi:ribosomal protein S1